MQFFFFIFKLFHSTHFTHQSIYFSIWSTMCVWLSWNLPGDKFYHTSLKIREFLNTAGCRHTRPGRLTILATAPREDKTLHVWSIWGVCDGSLKKKKEKVRKSSWRGTSPPPSPPSHQTKTSIQACRVSAAAAAVNSSVCQSAAAKVNIIYASLRLETDFQHFSLFKAGDLYIICLSLNPDWLQLNERSMWRFWLAAHLCSCPKKKKKKLSSQSRTLTPAWTALYECLCFRTKPFQMVANSRKGLKIIIKWNHSKQGTRPWSCFRL